MSSLYSLLRNNSISPMGDDFGFNVLNTSAIPFCLWLAMLLPATFRTAGKLKHAPKTSILLGRQL